MKSEFKLKRIEFPNKCHCGKYTFTKFRIGLSYKRRNETMGWKDKNFSTFISSEFSTEKLAWKLALCWKNKFGNIETTNSKILLFQHSFFCKATVIFGEPKEYLMLLRYDRSLLNNRGDCFIWFEVFLLFSPQRFKDNRKERND